MQIVTFSKSCAYILLKKVMKYLFKKAHQMSRKMRSKEQCINFYKWVIFQYQLKWFGHKLIFAGGFHANFKDSSFYNWSRRSYSAVLNINHDSFSMSFVIANSYKKVEGLMAFTKLIIAKKFDSLMIYAKQTKKRYWAS